MPHGCGRVNDEQEVFRHGLSDLELDSLHFVVLVRRFDCRALVPYCSGRDVMKRFAITAIFVVMDCIVWVLFWPSGSTARREGKPWNDLQC